MQILLENNQYIDETLLCQNNVGMYASALNKMNIYAKRVIHLNKVMHMNESNMYYKVSCPTYNSDIMFSISEQIAINNLLMQIKSHLYELMTEDILNHQQMLNEGFKDVWNKTKNTIKSGAEKTVQKVKDAKDNVVNKYDEIAEKFKSAMQFIDELIKKGISSVKELIKALGELLSKLGEKVSDALRKLGAFKSEETDVKPSLDSKLNCVEQDDEKNFFGYVCDYIQNVISNKNAFAKMKINEGWGHNLADKVANNKVLGFILNVAPNKKLSWWKSILVSIIGTLVICVALPMVLTGLGVAAPTVVSVVFAVKVLWASRSLLRVLINRELSRGNKQFFDFSTTIALIFSVLPIAMISIPAVHDFVSDCVRKVFELLHLEDAINAIDDWLNNVAKHLCGHYANWEEVQEKGQWVKEQIESVRHQGDLHTNLMHSGDTALNYIDGLFNKTDLNTFEGSSVLKTWMNLIADAHYSGSTDMLNHLPMIGEGAPLTAVLDGNTFEHIPRKVLTAAIQKYAEANGVHCELVDVCNQGLYQGTDHFAGVSYALVMDGNATSENAAIFNDILHNVAKDMHVHNVNAFGKIMNQIQDWGWVYQEGTVNDSIVHKLYDTIIDVFTPMYIPFFDKSKWGDYMLRIGSNASGYPAYKVTKVEHISVEDVLKNYSESRAVSLLLKHMEDVQKAHKTELEASIKQEKEENDGKFSDKFKKFFKHEKNKHNENANAKKREMMIIYISGKQTYKDENGKRQTRELKDQAAVVFDLNTMMCADIAKFTRRRRNYPYFMKGLFSKLDFIPTEKNDNATKDFIYEMLNKTFKTACEVCVTDGNGSMFIKKDDKGKYIPTDDNLASKDMFDLGNLSINDICDILNDKVDAYSFMAGKYGTNVSMRTNKNGDVIKKAKEDKKVIEKKRWKKTEDGKYVEDSNGELDFVDAKIIPFISRENSTTYKELHDDKKVHELLFDKDDKLDTDIITDKTLNLKQFLYRPMQTFSKDDKVKLAESVNKYLKGKSKDEKKDAYETIKTMIEIIWRGLYAAYRKHVQKKDAESSDNDAKLTSTETESKKD